MCAMQEQNSNQKKVYCQVSCLGVVILLLVHKVQKKPRTENLSGVPVLTKRVMGLANILLLVILEQKKGTFS